MRLNLKSYNLSDANDYMIRHIFRHYGTQKSVSEIATELGVSLSYLRKKMEELKIKPGKGRNPAEKERYFKRFHDAPWNKNIYFKKSSIDTVKKYLKLWVKTQGFKNYDYLVFQETDERQRVIVYLPKPW